MEKTKKKMFLVSFFGFLILMFFALLQNDFCYTKPWCNHLWETMNLAGLLFLPFIPLFLFSLITYKMRDEVFRAWFNFTKWWVPISIFLILITPGGSGGGFGIPSIFDKEFLAFILAALFFIISLVIIVRKSLKLRGR